jgi:hypothetical protein
MIPFSLSSRNAIGNPMTNISFAETIDNRIDRVPEGNRPRETSGVVKTHHGRPPKFIQTPWGKEETAGVDQIPALLQGGEIVIPKKYADRVETFLKKEDIILPGMR